MKRQVSVLAAFAVVLVGTSSVKAEPINVNIYSGFVDSGGGAPYSGLVGSFKSADILFATDTGYNWHPFGQGRFGADMTGNLSIAATGPYTFTLNSDDGSLLFIDGSLVVDNGGAHSPTLANGTTTLSAGIHPFEVQFFEDFGGPSGVDLYLPAGASYAVPEPATLTLLGLGGLSMLGYARWRHKRRLSAVPAA